MSFTIGQLSRMSGVSVETIRFYERKGLLSPARRRSSGYREYTENEFKRLKFIRKAKEHGFTLKEIEELLELRLSPESTCGDIKERAELKLRIIKKKIAELTQMRKAIEGLIASCHAGGPVGECPIIEAFEEIE
ncbi:MAG: MerR family transcriptional regulator [Calditrichaeota bacterium]|nr:MerR family transcriptional regulator [Calditrichota bacterium]